MAEVVLGFKAFDVHELGCHFVARHAGLYARRDLQTRLADTTFVPTADLPANCVQVACAAALSEWLGGANLRIVLVAAERPMFWLYGAADAGLDTAALGPIATYPPMSPPAAMLRRALDTRGLDIGRLEFLAARDDAARIGMLIDGSANAALVSSAVPPSVMSALGFRSWLFLGDEFRIATTGLAVTAEFQAREPGLVAALCAAHREALGLIHSDPERVAAALRAAGVGRGGHEPELAGLLARCFSRDGRARPDDLRQGAAELAAGLGIDSPRAVDGLYALTDKSAS